MAVLRVEDLPAEPLAAAADFHARVLPRIAAEFVAEPLLTLVLPAADYTHRAWRLAAIGSLARAWAPRRINAVAGDDPEAIAAALAFVEAAPAVTGQLLVLDSAGGEEVVQQYP